MLGIWGHRLTHRIFNTFLLFHYNMVRRTRLYYICALHLLLIFNLASFRLPKSLASKCELIWCPRCLGSISLVIMHPKPFHRLYKTTNIGRTMCHVPVMGDSHNVKWPCIQLHLALRLETVFRATCITNRDKPTQKLAVSCVDECRLIFLRADVIRCDMFFMSPPPLQVLIYLEL